MNYTEDEISEGAINALALIRAYQAGDTEVIDVILGNAGERELRAIAETYMGAFGDMLLRFAMATGVIGDEQMRAFILTADHDVIACDPELQAGVEKLIAAIQASIIADG